MLTFNEEEHKYYWNGEHVPSVTDIVNIVCGEYKGRLDPWYAKRGTDVHLACQYLDEGVLDWETLDEAYIGYVRAWEKYRAENDHGKIHLMEDKIYSEFGFAGTPDRIFIEKIVDIKTGSHDCRRHYIQMAGYMLLAKFNLSRDKFECVYIKDDGTYKVKEIEITQKEIDLFLAGIHIWKYRQPRIKRKKKEEI